MDISTLWKLAWALEAEAVQIELRGMDGSGKRREAVLAGEAAIAMERAETNENSKAQGCYALGSMSELF